MNIKKKIKSFLVPSMMIGGFLLVVFHFNPKKMSCFEKNHSTLASPVFVIHSVPTRKAPLNKSSELQPSELNQNQKSEFSFSSHQKTLLENLVFFSKHYQTKCMCDALNHVFFTTTQNKPLKGKIFASLHFNTNSVSNTFQPVSTTSTSENLPTPRKKVEKNYNILVGCGCTLAIQPSFIFPTESVFESNQTRLKTLTQGVNSNLVECEIEKANKVLFTRISNYLDTLDQKLQPAMKRRNIEYFQLTDFTVATLPRKETSSGITLKTQDDRDIVLKRHNFQRLFDESNIGNEYVLAQQLVDTFHDIRHSIIDINTNGIKPYKHQISTLLENGDNSRSSNSTLPTIQVYFKPRSVYKVNPTFSLDSTTKTMFLGLGKASFISNSLFSDTLGLLAGVDCGFRITPSMNGLMGYRFSGLHSKVFLGVGFQI